MSDPVYPSDEWQERHMRQIAGQIVRWKTAYYYGTPEVDDATFDLWWRNLLFLESKYPHLKDPNSPTNTVGAPLEAESEKRKLTLKEMMAMQSQKLTLDQMKASIS